MVINMKKINFTLSAVALVMSVAASSAFAEGQAPELTNEEKVLFSLNETAMGIMAGIVDATSCMASEGTYSYTADVTADFQGGNGVAILDDRSIDAQTIQNTLRGTVVEVSTSGSDEVGDVSIRGLSGAYHFSRLGEIMYNRNDFQINPNTLGSHWEDYDNHYIKDYYWGPVFGSKTSNGVLDAGLLVVTKQDDPRTKWRETSQYTRANGIDGKASLTLVQIAPDNAPLCKITMRKADVTDFGSGLQLFGSIKVKAFQQ